MNLIKKTILFSLLAATMPLAAQQIQPPLIDPVVPDPDMEQMRPQLEDNPIATFISFIENGDDASVRYWLQRHRDCMPPAIPPVTLSFEPPTMQATLAVDYVDFDINGSDDEGRTLLYHAARHGRDNIIRTIFSFDCLHPDVNKISTINGRTPINHAAARGHLEAVRELLKHSPDLTIAGDDRWTPLIIAIFRQYAEIAQLLKDAGAGFPEPVNTVEIAVENRYRNILNAALEAGHPNFPFNGYDAVLVPAVITENAELVSALLADGAACTARHEGRILLNEGRTLLNYANRLTLTDVAAALSAHGCPLLPAPADCLADGDKFYDAAMQACQECPADHETSDGESCAFIVPPEILNTFSYAKSSGRVSLANIVSLSVSVDVPFGGENSILLWAARNNNVTLANALISDGADTLALDDDNQENAYRVAARWGHFDVARAIRGVAAAPVNTLRYALTATMFYISSPAYPGSDMDYGAVLAASAEAAIDADFTITAAAPGVRHAFPDIGSDSVAMVQAAYGGNLPLVNALIADDATLDIADPAYFSPYTNITALMWAAGEGHLSVVEALVDEGADVNLRNNHGSTALDYAEPGGDVANYLRPLTDSP